jgi:site-specific recombinase XerD
MFTALYKRPAAVARHAAAPLLAQRLLYLEHLRDVGFARSTLIDYANGMLSVGEMLRWTLQRTVTAELLEAAVDRGVTSRRRRKAPGQKDKVVLQRIARGWLCFLGLLQADVQVRPGSEQIEAYARFMREERNLSPVTVRIRSLRAAEFLRLLAEQGRDLAGLGWRDVDRVLTFKRRHDGLTRTSLRTYALGLRDFVRFLEDHHHCRAGLADTLRPGRVYHGEALPAGPPWDVVCRMLDAMQADTDIDSVVRDRAIVMLFALYGLRASEVQRLSLDDLDWEHSIFRVRRSKQCARVECYPMAYAAAQALAAYIQAVRPKSAWREVFLQVRAPYRPLSTSALWQVVSRRLRPMEPGLKHHGPHALRHACATRLLERGMSMKEIGDFLGHRDPATTAVYAKVDLHGLRRVADVDLRRFL